MRLTGYKPEFQELCPKSISPIARQLVDHCFALLFEKHSPKVTIAECDSLEKPIVDTSVCLNELLRNDVVLDSADDTFQLLNNRFKVRHVLRASADGDHEIHLCANGLPVTSWKLQKILPIAKGKLERGECSACTYTSYVSSMVLDESANSLRTQFNLAQDEEADLLNEVSESAIAHKAGERAASYLAEILEPRRKQQEMRFDDLIAREPRYRPLRKFCKAELDNIAPDLSAEKYEQAVFSPPYSPTTFIEERAIA